MNPREMQKAMKRLGIKQEEIDAKEVVIKTSGKDLSYFDEGTKKKVVPHVVAEPSLGVDRTFLVFLLDAYEHDKKRENVVLHLNPKLSPVKVSVFPLLANKPELVSKAEEIFNGLKREFAATFDKSGSIGRRYARADEQGTPLCVTIDFDSIENDDVTIRERDSMEQKRVKVSELKEEVRKKIYG